MLEIFGGFSPHSTEGLWEVEYHLDTAFKQLVFLPPEVFPKDMVTSFSRLMADGFFDRALEPTDADCWVRGICVAYEDKRFHRYHMDRATAIRLASEAEKIPMTLAEWWQEFLQRPKTIALQKEMLAQLSEGILQTRLDLNRRQRAIKKARLTLEKKETTEHA